MANKKNKIELRDMSFSLEEEMAEYWDYYFGWMYDDDYCFTSSCTCGFCNPYLYEDEYEYIKSDEPEYLMISKRRSLYYPHPSIKIGGLINLDKVYSKEVMRDRKINELLGLSVKNPTVWDYYEKRRDI